MSQSLRQIESFADAPAPSVYFSEAPSSDSIFPRVVFASADDDPILAIDEADSQGSRISRFRALGSLTGSLLLHASLLLTLGMIVTVVHEPVKEIVLTDPINAAMSDEEVLDSEPLGAQIEVQLPAASSALDRVPRIADTFTPDDLKRKFAATQFQPVIKADEPQEHKILITPAVGKKFRYRKPGNGLAVTAGSFTVWTEPSDPLPRQPYFIVFQIRVPGHLEKFPKSDLKFEVWGTDQFHLIIPDPQRDFALVGDLDVIEGEVQIVLPIPGAPALVRDLIQVESVKILRERQRLTITF